MDIQSSIVKAFATFLLLSYVKLLNSTVDILLSVKVYNIHQEVVGVYVYYDASYKYFGKEHHPYVIIGVGVFFSNIRSFFLTSPSLSYKLLPNMSKLLHHMLHTFQETEYLSHFTAIYYGRYFSLYHDFR